jgi:uncharacterized membrane protein (UPF0127 family)
MKLYRLLIVLAGFAAILTSYASNLPVIELKAGKEKIRVEVAATPESQQLGLMYRTSLAPNSGMLFVFQDKAGHCFWMRNTLIPLAIAFIGDDGKIVNIEEMQANTETNHCPQKSVRYALEMTEGWFTQKKIKAGSLVEGLPKP